VEYGGLECLLWCFIATFGVYRHFVADLSPFFKFTSTLSPILNFVGDKFFSKATTEF
jgi:hypothetical protein